MNRAIYRLVAMLWMLVLACSCGCSALGLSLYPSTTKLTTDASRILASSPLPSAMPRENAKAVLPVHTLQPGEAVLVGDPS